MIMKRFFLTLAVLAVALTLGSMTASAQTQITLGPTAPGSVVFVGSSGTVSITLGTCSAGTCTAPGSSASLGGTDSYTLVQTGPITLSSAGVVIQSNPISFSYGDGKGGTLTGNLQLVNFVQAGSLGNFNDNLVANLTNVGGTLASTFGSSAQNDITIRITSGGSVVNLFSKNGTVAGLISSGEVFATPEPNTVFLFGVGLLALAAIIWRRGGLVRQDATV